MGSSRLLFPEYPGRDEAASPERRIGNGPPPPKHRPTTAVPSGLLQDVPDAARAAAVAKADALVCALRASLGEPYLNEGGMVLYQRDSLDVMAAMQQVGQAVDLTITSPPYNIGKAYEQNRPLDQYLEWCTRWIQQISSLTTERGSFWLNVGYLEVPRRGRCVPIAYLLWDKSSMFLQQEIVWHYGAGVASRWLFSPRNEKWLFYTKSETDYVFNLDDVRDPDVKYPNQKKDGKFRCNPLGKNPSDVWSIPKVTTGRNRSSKERAPHPAQFPLAVVDRIVKVSSNYSDLVFDPFSGSGSSGIAAVGNGRAYIGCELRADYCAATVERFRNYQATIRDAVSQAQLSLL